MHEAEADHINSSATEIRPVPRSSFWQWNEAGEAGEGSIVATIS
jgi:hypothetical protein